MALLHRCGTVAVAGLTLLLAACTAATPQPAPSPGQPNQPAPSASVAPVSQKPQYGGIFRTTTSNPRIGQDPIKGNGTPFTSNFGRAYDNLVRFKFDAALSEGAFIIAPDLAEKWDNPTPTTWVFSLGKGIKWQNIPPVNGREFVADDVVYSINRLAGPGSAHAGYWTELEKVEALDKYTVKVTLKSPVASFLMVAALGFNKMMAKEAVDGAGGQLDKGPTIGTGAWFVTCTEDVGCNFKRNPEYHLKDDAGNQLPYLDGMSKLVLPDPASSFAAFRAKKLDTLSLTSEQVDIVKRQYPDVAINTVKSFAGPMIHIRNDKAPWSDERVRMALSKVVNRQEIIDTIYGGKGWLFFNWYNPADDWYLPQDELKAVWKQDIEGAKKLLAEAGYPNGFDAQFWVAQTGVYPVMGELLVTQMAKAGIRVKMSVNEYSGYLSQIFIRNGRFDDLAFGPQGPIPDDLWLSSYYHSKGTRNSSYVNDPKLDGMIEAQRSELNGEKRKQLIIDIQRYLVQKNYQLVIQGNITDNGVWPWLKNRSYAAGADYPGLR
ncbi:MAG: ABC transporter substrate-binding protein, partial [Chloroflexi bacterium]|nr:ABC transporter substrate-binding protein [Chloroflexota bacterium]